MPAPRPTGWWTGVAVPAIKRKSRTAFICAALSVVPAPTIKVQVALKVSLDASWSFEMNNAPAAPHTRQRPTHKPIRIRR